MKPQETIDALGLTVAAQFVPFSKSRNAKEAKTASDLSLNWIVTVERNGKPVVTTDYMQGIGHAPASKLSVAALGHANSVMRFDAQVHEAETGKQYRNEFRFGMGNGRHLDPPTSADVLYSLVSDASAIDHPTFESWAEDYGYDTDSRSGEVIYRACLETALKLRAAIGDAGLEQLREAFHDY